MKSWVRSVVAFLLNLLARGILIKYRPQIIMVTGSVGKTSTKDAIGAALRDSFYVRASEKSYNSELGMPLTIIGAKTPWSNPGAWLRVFIDAFFLIVFPSHYPKLLVLEVGADHPGDLKRLLKIATPSIVVVTKLPEVPVHVEAYADPDEVREEEFAPAYMLPHGAPLIISSEDPYAEQLSKGIHASIVRYGYAEDASVRIEKPELVGKGEERGMKAVIKTAGEKGVIFASGVIGTQQLYAPAAALATALALGVSIETALASLKQYQPPPGRARMLEGKGGSILIDDSYNASPAAVEEALNSLSLVASAKRRIAVLGDMLELGRYSVSEHERIGTIAAEKADMVVVVGPRAAGIGAGALTAGMKESHIHALATSAEAAAYLAGIVGAGDVVLVKGSQGVRMERIVEELLDNPGDVTKLARQDDEWRRR